MVGVNPSVTPSVDPTPRASRAVASPFPSPPPSACAAHRKPPPPPPPPPRQPQTEKLPLKQSTRLPLPQRNLRPFFLLLLHPTKRKQESAPTQQSLLPASPEPAQHRILRPPLRFLNPAEPSIHCPTTNGRRGGSFRCPFSGVTNHPGPGPVPAIYPISLRFCVGKAPPTPTKPSNGAALSATRGRARRACRLAGAGTLVLRRLSLPASSWGGPNLHSVQFPPPPGKAGRYSTLACVWGFARCFPTVQSFAKFGRPRILVPLKLLAAPNLGVWEESSESWPPAPWLVRRRQKKKLPMEPPSSSRLWASLWTFIKFLPYFCGLFILGLIKGILLCPWACLIMAIGISALILGLWPMHLIWTYYCIIRTKMVGPVVKLLLLVAATVILILWLIIGIPGSVLAGLLYGFLAPIMATFDAVGEGKENTFVHCFVDGTWSTITGSCTVVRDLKDMLFHSYFSVMDDLRFQTPPGGKPYEIRLLDIPGALLSAACGLMLDVIMFTLIAIYKCPVMLFKGWKRLIQDLIGREGPFLETACVPFAGLAILLWPFAVLGAVLASILSSIPLGMYGAVVAYQESSVVMGLSYAVSSVSIFDEYTNDVLDMAPGSCFPKLKYRKQQNEDSSHGGHLSKPVSFDKENQEGKKPLARVTSFKNSMDEFNPFKMLDHLFAECKRQGEVLVNEGLITMKDIQETKSGKVGSGVLNVGLPAYVILNALLRSAKSNSNGLILSDGAEITSDNRPKSTLFDWFFDPLMIIKEQIKAENFTEEEEEYLKMRVLMVGEPSNLKGTLPHVPSLNERKKAEIDAFARRLQGITKSISRYPTSKRRFDVLVKSLLSELERTMGGSVPANGSQALRLRGGIARMLSQKSIGKTANIMDEDPEAQVTRKARTP